MRSALGPMGHCKLLHPKHIFISLANVGLCQETTQRGILVIRETKREDLGAYVQGFIYYSRWLCGVNGVLRKAACLSKKHMESSCYLVRRLLGACACLRRRLNADSACPNVPSESIEY